MVRDNVEVLELGNADLVGEGTWTGTPDTVDGHAAPLPGYPHCTWPTCSPVIAEWDRAAVVMGGVNVAILAAMFGVVL